MEHSRRRQARSSIRKRDELPGDTKDRLPEPYLFQPSSTPPQDNETTRSTRLHAQSSNHQHRPHPSGPFPWPPKLRRVRAAFSSSLKMLGTL
ncbi:hypothetical protein N431DRAFT_437830 [Stipitochalara longipes BDJ]|nr:hypothetical protein N431DRAFT_437830 [Stipitochalara longipes BDJ]